MFRKGIVTFFDDRLGLGHIELMTDHQRILFKLEDFSNISVLPQIGERVKCVVIEQDGDLFAKFIVRLDYKNYVADKKGQRLSDVFDDENSFENVRNARKILKKRRAAIDAQPHPNDLLLGTIRLASLIDPSAQASDRPIQTDEDTSELANIELAPHQENLAEKTDSADSVEDAHTVRAIDATKNNLQAEELTRPVEAMGVVEESESDEHIQVEQTHVGVESAQATELIELIQDHAQTEQSLDPMNITPVVEQSERLSDSEIPLEIQSAAVAESVQPEVKTQLAKTELIHQVTPKVENIPVLETVVARGNIQHMDHIADLEIEFVDPHHLAIHQNITNLSKAYLNQQLLEKNMSLNVFQKLLQNIKVRFLYSKRKQIQIQPESEKRKIFNPWILIIAMLLLCSINFIFYAYDRYKQYQSESLLKLQQYQKAQKEEIKRQKQKAIAP